MALDKAIKSGKEHRKAWVGKDKSKNIDCTCRNHGSCDYCKSNRLYKSTKTLQSAKEKMKHGE